ncbi:MAG: DUF3015 family protein [Hyphomonadaceae bacterium]
MKLAILSLAALIAAGAGVAQAQTPAKSDRIINPFSDCGLGAAFFPNKDQAWLAVTTNVTWDVGTTAVISAVSSPNTCSGGRAQTAQLITKTYASLEAETAVGEGKYLEAMADVMVCNTEVRPVLFQRVRAGMGVVMAQPGFADLDRVKKAEAYFNVVDHVAKSEFSDSCSMT